MTDKMWKNIFLSLLTIGTFLHRLTSFPIDCATRVQKCPVEKDQWTQKNNLLKCAANYGYVCLRDSDGYLFETCMANFPVQANSGNCPILFDCKRNKAYLGPEYAYYSCPEEVSGCPPKNHAEYSIHQLYKYRKCIESKFSAETGNTSYIPKSTTSISMRQIENYMYNYGQSKHLYVNWIVIIAVLLTLTACFLICCALPACDEVFSLSASYALSARDEVLSLSEGYALSARDEVLSLSEGYDLYASDEVLSLSEGAQDGQTTLLRSIVREINESEADRIQSLHNEYKIKADGIFTPVSISDRYEIHTGDLTNITLDKMFYVQQKNHDKKRARFVFIVGEDGYGNTLQCLRISKVWCQTWKNENTRARNRLGKDGNDLESEHLERSLEEFDFLFFIQMRNVKDKNVSLIDMIQDAYSYYLSTKQTDDIRKILERGECKCLVLLDGLDEWNLSTEKKKTLSDKCIPDCRDMPNCTILITMTSWEFIELNHICSQTFVKVVQLHDIDDNGIKQ